ncbi:MAG: APC family permease [Sulfobacillus sp.]|nr:APC family permease [Sulfobacillus sp.]
MSHLKRALSLTDLLILGIAGAVGTGVLFSTAGMTAVAGPGVVVAWLIGAVMYLFVGLTYVELGQIYPEAGGPSRYSLYTHGRMTNLINAFSDLIWYLFIPPIEALATVEGLNYFWPQLINSQGNPTTLGALLGVVLMILFLPFNYFGIRAFSRATNLLGLVKILLYALTAIGFISFARFENFTHYGGLTPFGFQGIWAAIPLGMFAFGGIRVIPDYAEETKDTRSLARSIIWVVLGQTVVYLLFAVGFLTGLNWHAVKTAPGQWQNVDKMPGNPFLTLAHANHGGWLIPLTIAIAVIGPFVTGYIYQGAGSRVLLAMSRSGLVARRLGHINQDYQIPAWSLAVFTAVGAIVAYLTAPLPSIYNLISDAVVAGYIGFAVNPVVMWALRADGRPGRLAGGKWIAAVAFAASSLIVYWSGWPAVPYAVIILAVAALLFGLVYRVGQGFAQALWYIGYIAFLTLMTYIGGVGAKSWVNSDWGSLIVVVVSLVLFLPWGIRSRHATLAAE